MVLKIHSPNNFIAAKRVAVILKEKNVPYEIVHVDVSVNEHKTSAYLEKQPFGQVPYIDDDGFILHTAHPRGSEGERLFEQAASIELSNFDTFASRYLLETYYKKRAGGVPDEKLVAATLNKLNANLDVYDVILSKQKYLAGDEITLADLFHLPWGNNLIVAGNNIMDTPERPNLGRWWKEISSRPSWQAVKDAA